MAFTITENCIGCMACSKKCPVMAIDGEKKKMHIINEKRCVACGVCQRICPKGAVLDSVGSAGERLPKSQWPKPKVNQSLCSACGICMDVCIFEAIKISYPKFNGDLKVFAYLDEPEHCVGCSQCEKMCPLQAIKMEVG
ncbi:4Fe-4S binding protein [Acetobacterium malicum]|uniref:4Fe-4S binding protein n=1 Tax=Acetobacterium malicum TaxID=52692 RepID=UPI0004206315|nr:4Fe-4S binding protein [Acetobacterium dehalogenans]